MTNNQPYLLCQHCGRPLDAKSIQGLCPACLMKAGWPTSQETEPEAFEPPAIEDAARLFPQLEIIELIGRGGMGAVYKARQPDLDRFVALKILAKKAGDDSGFSERFTREARALARLSHPHIVGVHDFGHAGELSYFIMEYVDGPNLREIQGAGHLSPTEALTIIPQICAALQFAHDAGVVHRDIKPENILLDQKGCVKIADFGLAKILGQERTYVALTEAHHVMGTPHYMAPEQVEHPKDVDHRADIYSLGVVFYEMLTGELPLGRFVPPSEKVQIDVRLDEVVLKTLAKEPERRYQHAMEVKTEIQAIGHEIGDVDMNPDSKDIMPDKPVYSRSVIWGGVWALVMVVWYVWSYTPFGWAITGALRDSVLSPLEQGGDMLLMIVGFAGPVGITVLGWMALRDIRFSPGRTRGMVPALCEALLFPLLVVNGWFVWLCSVLAKHSLGERPTGAMIGVALALLLDGFVFRWIWIRLQRRPDPETVRAWVHNRFNALTHRSAAHQIWHMVQRTALVAVASLLLFETSEQMSLHWRESSGELLHMAIRSTTFAGMFWAAWPLRSRFHSFLWPVGVGFGLFVIYYIASYNYAMHLRPNLGLYQESDWVSQHPGFQRAFRKRIAANLWGQENWPATFAPALSVAFPLAGTPDVILVDLDQSKSVVRPKLMIEDSSVQKQLAQEGWDLAAHWKGSGLVLMALRMHVVYVPKTSWEAVRTRDIIGYWKLEQKLPAERTPLRSTAKGPSLYYFQTRAGAMGLMDVMNREGASRGKHLRYKLVDHTE